MKKAIYFDMDGVLVDWVARYHEVAPVPLAVFNELPKAEKNKLKEGLFSYEFFREMKPLKHGIELLEEYARNPEYDVYVCSATGYINTEEVLRAKIEWLKEHVPAWVEIKEALFVPKVEMKHEKKKAGYAEHILIDDRAKAVEAWEAHGEKAILFV